MTQNKMLPPDTGKEEKGKTDKKQKRKASGKKN
jgi:hypothetical protein